MRCDPVELRNGGYANVPVCVSVCIVSFEVYIVPCAGCHHACGVTLLAQVHVHSCQGQQGLKAQATHFLVITFKYVN